MLRLFPRIQMILLWFESVDLQVTAQNLLSSQMNWLAMLKEEFLLFLVVMAQYALIFTFEYCLLS